MNHEIKAMLAQGEEKLRAARLLTRYLSDLIEEHFRDGRESGLTPKFNKASSSFFTFL